MITRAELIRDLREHAPNCTAVGSPLYGALLELVATGLENDDAWWRFFEPHAADPPRSLLPIRFLALFHRLALAGELPELAACYPTCGGIANAPGAFQAIEKAVRERGSELTKRMPARVQTNEVGRCRALIPGFREIAAATGPEKSWRLLELGCSAGLNLLWDQYGFDLGFAPPPHIIERSGCDAAPVAATGESLLPFIWPDQLDRFELLQHALRVAAKQPPTVDRADALDWAAAKLVLSVPENGVATVLFHSIFWLYLDAAAQTRLESIIREAGSRATAASPLAWLRMESAHKLYAEVHLTLWPGDGRTRRIARTGYHGAGVELLGNEG